MIVWKVALAGLMALVQVSATQSQPPVEQYQHPLVKRVLCMNGRGTAFRISETQMVSVDHVTNKIFCTIDGSFIRAAPEPGDFSTIQHPARRTNALKVNCDGFKVGEYYWAVGHARGEATQTTVRLIATGQEAEDGMQILWGSPTVIPGMSGGPVLNSAGEVVGTVNMYALLAPFSLSRPLKGTSVCS